MTTTVEVILFGAIAGLSVGLTGGGGAVIAVPLLVYGLGLDVPQAVAISIVAVGGAAVASFGNPTRRSEVDPAVGAMLAAGGVLAAPFGAMIGARLEPTVVLTLFGLLVSSLSVRMWITAKRPADMTLGPCAISRRISWRCITVLSVTGITTGLLSGIFGVGGGFIVVPAIVFATGMAVHHAVATSLMVVSLVSASAFLSMLAHGRDIPWATAVPFLIGGILGMVTGTRLCHLLSAQRLQQGFAVLLGLIGAIVVIESIVG